jgi:hypothetical protein
VKGTPLRIRLPFDADDFQRQLLAATKSVHTEPGVAVQGPRVHHWTHTIIRDDQGRIAEMVSTPELLDD